MKRWLALIIIALALLAAGCSVEPTSGDADTGGTASAEAVKVDGAGTVNEAAGEMIYFPAFDSNYKTARNDVFDFWFDIPGDWKAVDKSDTGEQLTIDPSNDNVSLLVYGTLINGGEEDFYKKLSGTDGSIEDFTFRDGWMGKKITDGTKLYYLRTDGDTYIIFYANYKDDSAWFSENRDTLEYIGQSLRSSRESFGNMDAENSILLDDLQLGGIRLDMSYEKVLEVMRAEPEESADNNDGVEEKTLFYKDGTEIYLVNGAVYSVNVISGSYPTPRGLKVGDTADRLKELYGEPDNKNDETHWGYTYDGYELLSVVLKDNKVSEIQIDQVM